MPQIPDSRVLPFVSTRSGRIAPSGPAPILGDAMAEAGRSITRASYDLQDLYQAEQEDAAAKRGYDLDQKLIEFRTAEEKTLNDAMANATDASGIGFTRQFLEEHQKRTNEFIKANFQDVPEAMNAQARSSLLGLGNSLYDKAFGYEQKTKSVFYDRTTNDGLDAVRTQIRSNAAPFDQLKSQGLDLINKANMPEPWKAERRAVWDADAKESEWRWKFSQDPNGAVAAISPAKSFVDKVIGAESGGNANAKNPRSSATGAGQFISSTWLAMVDKYRPDLKEGRSTQEVLALRNDPSLSREMVQHYTDENARFLTNQGLQTTDGNLYLAHFLGPRGAAQVLKADPGTPIVDIVGRDAVSANPFLAGKTAGDVKAWSDKKMGSAPSHEYDAIPYDRRDQLAQWGQTQIDRNDREMLAAQKAMLTSVKDSFSKRIALGDLPTDREILSSGLDDGDQAALINSRNAKQGDGIAVQQIIAGMSDPNVQIDALDTKARKAVDGAYNEMVKVDQNVAQPAAEQLAQRYGVVPEPYLNAIRTDLMSRDSGTVQGALQRAQRVYESSPSALTREGGAQVEKDAVTFKSLVNNLGFTPEEATKKIMALNDPEKRKSVNEADANKITGKIDIGQVTDAFDPGVFSSEPQAGFTNTQSDAMLGDYRELFRLNYLDTGDEDAAKARTIEQFKRMYGVTQITQTGTIGKALGSGVLMKYPPEAYYPVIGGSQQYLQDQLLDAAKEASGNADLTADKLFIVSTPKTSADIRAGRPPSYAIGITTEDANGYPVYDVLKNGMQFQFDAKSAKDAYTQSQRDIFDAAKTDQMRTQKLIDMQKALQNNDIEGYKALRGQADSMTVTPRPKPENTPLPTGPMNTQQKLKAPWERP